MCARASADGGVYRFHEEAQEAKYRDGRDAHNSKLETGEAFPTPAQQAYLERSFAVADTDADNRLSKAEVHALLRAQVPTSFFLSLFSLCLSVSRGALLLGGLFRAALFRDALACRPEREGSRPQPHPNLKHFTPLRGRPGGFKTLP